VGVADGSLVIDRGIGVGVVELCNLYASTAGWQSRTHGVYVQGEKGYHFTLFSFTDWSICICMHPPYVRSNPFITWTWPNVYLNLSCFCDPWRHIVSHQTRATVASPQFACCSRPCLVSIKIQKIFKIPRYIESCDTYMKH